MADKFIFSKLQINSTTTKYFKNARYRPDARSYRENLVFRGVDHDMLLHEVHLERELDSHRNSPLR